MRKSRFNEAQVIGILKEQEAGLPTVEVCRKHRVSSATFYKMKSKYGGIEVSDAHKLKTLENKNANLRRVSDDSDNPTILSSQREENMNARSWEFLRFRFRTQRFRSARRFKYGNCLEQYGGFRVQW